MIGMKEVKWKDYTVKGWRESAGQTALHEVRCEVWSTKCEVLQEEYKVWGEQVGEDETCQGFSEGGF